MKRALPIAVSVLAIAVTIIAIGSLIGWWDNTFGLLLLIPMLLLLGASFALNKNDKKSEAKADHHGKHESRPRHAADHDNEGEATDEADTNVETPAPADSRRAASDVD